MQRQFIKKISKIVSPGVLPKNSLFGELKIKRCRVDKSREEKIRKKKNRKINQKKIHKKDFMSV